MPSWLSKSCDNLGYSHPTAVQKEAIPVILSGKDVVLQAQTGSGKTLSFGIPILAQIDPNRAAVQAVIVVPTRELGLQVTSVLRQLASPSPQKIMIMSVMEGSKNRRQILWATAEPPHIVVGNPRALQRMVDSGRLRLNAVSFVVLDEVDAILIQPETRQELHRLLSRHLSNSFNTAEDDVSSNLTKMKESLVFKNLAKDVREAEKFRSNRQTIMCSATIPQRQYFAAACMKNGWTEGVPEVVHVSASELLPAQVVHEYIPCSPQLVFSCVTHIIKTALNRLPPGESKRAFQTIVFTDSTDHESIHRLEMAIRTALHDVDSEGDSSVEVTDSGEAIYCLLDDMGLEERSDALDAFRDGSCSVLICSDLAARGLDIPNTGLVIQMSLPETSDVYLHRAGRTGRLGRPGKVVTIAQNEEAFVVQRFQNELGIEITLRNLRAIKKTS